MLLSRIVTARKIMKLLTLQAFFFYANDLCFVKKQIGIFLAALNRRMIEQLQAVTTDDDHIGGIHIKALINKQRSRHHDLLIKIVVQIVNSWISCNMTKPKLKQWGVSRDDCESEKDVIKICFFLKFSQL